MVYLSEQQFDSVTALEKAIASEDITYNNFFHTAEPNAHVFKLVPGQYGIEAEIIITTGGGYQIFAFVDGRRVTVKDPEKSVPNWTQDPVFAIRELDRAISKRVKNRAKNKKLREERELKHYIKEF